MNEVSLGWENVVKQSFKIEQAVRVGSEAQQDGVLKQTPGKQMSCIQ